MGEKSTADEFVDDGVEEDGEVRVPVVAGVVGAGADVAGYEVWVFGVVGEAVGGARFVHCEELVLPQDEEDFEFEDSCGI